jgi:hypothetical protein
MIKFFGDNNLAFANAHEWRKRRKVSVCAYDETMQVAQLNTLVYP